jgi:hypothetical protein
MELASHKSQQIPVGRTPYEIEKHLNQIKLLDGKLQHISARDSVIGVIGVIFGFPIFHGLISPGLEIQVYFCLFSLIDCSFSEQFES